MAIKPGSMVALVTPMKPDGAIDEQQLRDILRWHVECETDGVVVLGTTGEVRMLVCACACVKIKRAGDGVGVVGFICLFPLTRGRRRSLTSIHQQTNVLK